MYIIEIDVCRVLLVADRLLPGWRYSDPIECSSAGLVESKRTAHQHSWMKHVCSAGCRLLYGRCLRLSHHTATVKNLMAYPATPRDVCSSGSAPRGQVVPSHFGCCLSYPKRVAGCISTGGGEAAAYGYRPWPLPCRRVGVGLLRAARQRIFAALDGVGTLEGVAVTCCVCSSSTP